MKPLPPKNSPRAFTLIEMLVVIAIITLLIGAVVAIGSQVRAQATRRATLLQLKTLDGIMKDYLEAGNPEPIPFAVGATWPYRGVGASVTYWWPTTPASDMCNWVIAFKSDPKYAKRIENMTTETDANLPANAGYSGPTGFKFIMDGYGAPVRYVPSTTAKPGYFVSAGPDTKFSNSVTSDTGANPNAGLRADEIYSYDPQ